MAKKLFRNVYLMVLLSSLAVTACSNPYTNDELQGPQRKNAKFAKSSKKLKDPKQMSFQWPADGIIVPQHKGLDIAGKIGTPIKAAADGVVVYSGHGLKQYGNLVIIKHNQDFLTVYAHNQVLNVKEGERVTKGQVVALMGKSAAERVKLHFEVRYQGKPQDPLKFLPKI
jgi:lipoprotein NlpD